MNYLSIENISKGYGDKLLFENLSFGIDQGQKVALVGSSGAGKSTILQLLLQFYPLDQGKILVDRFVR